MRKRKVITMHVAVADATDNDGPIEDSHLIIQVEGKLKGPTKKAIQHAIKNQYVDVREAPRVVC